jgi:hypothetical protein
MKTYPNKQRYYQILKAMSPQDKLMKAFELSDLTNSAFRAGLKNRYPNLTDGELHKLYLEKRLECYNRTY